MAPTLRDPGARGSPPDDCLERALRVEGFERVAGIDEVGRGAWAGPASVGVVVFAADVPPPDGLRDSKELAEDRREALYPLVTRWCVEWSVGHADGRPTTRRTTGSPVDRGPPVGPRPAPWSHGARRGAARRRRRPPPRPTPGRPMRPVPPRRCRPPVRTLRPAGPARGCRRAATPGRPGPSPSAPCRRRRPPAGPVCINRDWCHTANLPCAHSPSREYTTLPMALRGSSSTTRTRRGRLNGASVDAVNSSRSSIEGGWPSGTIHAVTTSPHSSEGVPVTATSATRGCPASTSSTSRG